MPHILYSAPMTSALAPHIALAGYGLAFELEWVERGPKRRIATAGYAALNPKAKVPALRLPDGELLTEAVAILVHLEETHGPARTPAQRRRLLEWLSFLATELHQTILGPTFDPESPPEAKHDAAARQLPAVLEHLESAIAQRATLLGGDEPSTADFYLLWGVLLLEHAWPERLAGSPLVGFRQRMWSFEHVREPIRIQRAAYRDRTREG